MVGWLEKNNDKLSDDFEKLIASSSHGLLKEDLAKPDEDAGGGGPRKPKKGGAQTVGPARFSSNERLIDYESTTN